MTRIELNEFDRDLLVSIDQEIAAALVDAGSAALTQQKALRRAEKLEAEKNALLQRIFKSCPASASGQWHFDEAQTAFVQEVPEG